MPGEVLLHDHQKDLLRKAFLGWQCRIRQYAMREGGGRPSPGMCPDVYLGDSREALGAIITLIHRADPYDDTMQFKHLYKKTQDPAERQSGFLKVMQSTHYQRANEFGDTLTALFSTGSQGAAQIANEGECRLVFEQQNQSYDLLCEVWPLTKSEPLYQATYWHNALLNPNLQGEPEILVFKPDWSRGRAEPPPPGFSEAL